MFDTLSAALAASPLCQDLDEDELQDLASRGRVEHWPEGARIMEEGLGGPRMVVLLEGEVQISKQGRGGREHPIATAGPGSVLGEVSLLCASPRSATVIASSPLRVFAMDRAVLQTLLDEGAPVATKLLHSLAQVLACRLMDASERMVDLMEQLSARALQEEVARVQAEMHVRWDFKEGGPR